MQPNICARLNRGPNNRRGRPPCLPYGDLRRCDYLKLGTLRAIKQDGYGAII